MLLAVSRSGTVPRCMAQLLPLLSQRCYAHTALQIRERDSHSSHFAPPGALVRDIIDDRLHESTPLSVARPAAWRASCAHHGADFDGSTKQRREVTSCPSNTSMPRHQRAVEDQEVAAAAAASEDGVESAVGCGSTDEYHSEVCNNMLSFCCFNPFNGKMMDVRADLYQRLTRLGFLRDPRNTLRLTWSAEQYRSELEAMQTKLQQQQQQQQKQHKQQQQQEQQQQQQTHETTVKTRPATDTAASAAVSRKKRRSKASAASAVGSLTSLPTSNTHKEKAEEEEGRRKTSSRTIEENNSMRSEESHACSGTASATPTDRMSASVFVVSTNEAFHKLLRPFEKPSAAPWRKELAKVMRAYRRDGGDVARVVRQYYAKWLTAYMPPKLTASPDATLLPTCHAQVPNSAGRNAGEEQQHHRPPPKNDDNNGCMNTREEKQGLRHIDDAHDNNDPTCATCAVSDESVSLTPDQSNIVQLALSGYSLYVGGSAGTGKTTLLKCLHHKLSSILVSSSYMAESDAEANLLHGHTRCLRVALTATTGVAAVQLGGRTFHHAFGAPLDVCQSTRSWDSNALRVVDVVILDEVSLLDAAMLDVFDRQARLARMNNVPFGGLQIVACGDFMQLRHMSGESIPAAYHSHIFATLLKLKLVTQLRHRGDDALLSLLANLRCGYFDAQTFAALDRPVPPGTKEVTYLYPCRREAQLLNSAKLSELTTKEMIFTPQHGAVQLLGRFTASAWIEWQHDTSDNTTSNHVGENEHMNGIYHSMRNESYHHADRSNDVFAAQSDEEWRSRCANAAPEVPTRAHLLLTLREALATVCSPEAADEVADHDCVFMPILTPHAHSICVRLRLAEVSVMRSMSYVLPSSHTVWNRRSKQQRQLQKRSGTNADEGESEEDEGEMESEYATMSTQRRARSAFTISAGHWERVVRYWVERLPGSPKLRGFLNKEPVEIIPPLAISAIVDPGNPDVAERLAPLRLKLGCRVMVNRNLSRTVSNGSVGVVESFAPMDRNLLAQPNSHNRALSNITSHAASSNFVNTTTSNNNHSSDSCNSSLTNMLMPVVRLLTGEVMQVSPVTQTLGGTPQTYFYSQELAYLPLQLGYGFTVHKVQGLTLDGTVVLDCARCFTCPHLLYVACSRVRCIDQLIVRNVNAKMAVVDSDALHFAESLRDASDHGLLEQAKGAPRAAWTQHDTHE